MRSLAQVDVDSFYDGNEDYKQDAKPAECEDFDELATRIRMKVPLEGPSEKCLVFAICTLIGLRVPGPLIWGHIVGPSGALKTTVTKLVATASDKCYSTSKFNGLYSGVKGKNGEDQSLAPRLQGKVLVLHDLTPFLADKDKWEDISGQFRDIYEGTGGADYNNGHTVRYDKVAFGVLTAVTHNIRTFNRTDLGERFLMSDIDAFYNSEGRYQTVELQTKGVVNAYDSALDTIISGLGADDDIPIMDNLGEERLLCWGFINHLCEWISEENSNLIELAKSFVADRDFKLYVDTVADWVEHARCVPPGKGSDSSVRNEPAKPHRTIKQLTKISLLACIVHKQFKITQRVKDEVRHWAFSTGHSLMLEIMNYLAHHPRYPKEFLAEVVRFSSTKVAFCCEHLISIGVVESSLEDNGSGRRGRKAMCYSLTPKFRAYADILGMKAKDRSVASARLNKRLPSFKELLRGDTPAPPPKVKMSLMELLQRKKEGDATR